MSSKKSSWRRWTDQELEMVRQLAITRRRGAIQIVARTLGRTDSSVKSCMRSLGIKPPEYIADASSCDTDRLCTACRKRKPLEDFTKWSKGRDGLSPHCRACKKKKRLAYMNRNRATLSKRQREYRLKNLDAIKTYAKKYYQQNKTLFRQHRTKNLRKKYRITNADFDRMAESQGYVCAICRSLPQPRFGVLCVDHDHATGVVRGLLCHNCNSAIGLLKESAEIVHSAFKYMEAHDGRKRESA